MNPYIQLALYFINFAVSIKVTAEFKQAVLALEENQWHPLFDKNDKTILTQQEWAEVCFVPGWIGYKKSNPDYRFIRPNSRLKPPPFRLVAFSYTQSD